MKFKAILKNKKIRDEYIELKRQNKNAKNSDYKNAFFAKYKSPVQITTSCSDITLCVLNSTKILLSNTLSVGITIPFKLVKCFNIFIPSLFFTNYRIKFHFHKLFFQKIPVISLV